MHSIPGGQMFAKRMQQVFSSITEITIEELHQKILSNKPFYLIDVREEAEWRKGALPDANHLSRGLLELNIENMTADPEADIVLYCGGGTRSALAAESLQNMGYKNVKSLQGGFRGWKARDLHTIIPL